MYALHCRFSEMGMLSGTTSSYMAKVRADDEEQSSSDSEAESFLGGKNDEDNDGGPVSGNPSGAMSDIKLTAKSGTFFPLYLILSQYLIKII